MQKALELVERGFLHLASGQAENHPRRRLQLGASATLHYMTAVDNDAGYLGAKLYTTHPQTGVHFTVLLYAADGRPLASIEANALGQIRTGAASGVATKLLARPDARVLALIGGGFQGETQLEAIAQVRVLREVRVFSRSAEKRRSFAERMGRKLALSIRAVDSAEEAVRACDIAVTATSSRDPVLLGEWLSAGMHVNAIGGNHARRRELDTAAVERASLIVADSIEQARIESGELIAAFDQAPQKWDRVVELADVCAGKSPRRRSPADITLFKSNGLALEDIAVAGFIYEQLAGKPEA